MIRFRSLLPTMIYEKSVYPEMKLSYYKNYVHIEMEFTFILAI